VRFCDKEEESFPDSEFRRDEKTGTWRHFPPGDVDGHPADELSEPPGPLPPPAAPRPPRDGA
jgi:hypothetical protein